MNYHTLFYTKFKKKMLQNLLSDAVVIGALRVKYFCRGSTSGHSCQNCFQF